MFNNLHIILLILLCGACGVAPKPFSPQPSGGENAEARTLLGAMLSIEEVDSMAFKPSGARIGLQSYFSYSSPVLNFTLPKKSNYAEVLRCGDSLKVMGHVDAIDVRTLDLGYGFTEQHDILKRNDFWESALAAGCKLITTGLADESFFDIMAPDGSSFYIVRTCVLGERVAEQSQGQEPATPVCSHMLATTSVLRYVNERVADQKQKLAEMQQLSDKAFGLTRQAISIAVRLDTELGTCQTETAARAQRKSIFDWLQQGLGIAKIIFPILGVSFDANTASDALTQIKNLFSGAQPNLPASCQFAITLQSEGKVLASEIEALQKKYLAAYGQVSQL